ncbi:ATP-dependent helicase HrpB [Oricola thermophila]|uniref:ATP-dependent helicase HrpB n=1 Tax=Oricola thermophila TaxID=2742145 RepID=A0A6N1VIH6_9HYPH|nr:ATP-dependent helicase HrpB [Oricola thermophila]QKV20680.1 ATP-dependent helicase HrpB [Oricola thermophila]
MKTLPDLPVAEVLGELKAALSRASGAVLVAPPGAGKTTLVPLSLLDEGWLEGRRIVVLEPRRLAARAAARRMAELLGEKVGETVGYRMRMDTRVGPRTRIEVVTEGVFQRMITGDPELSGVGAVLFDEFHERSLDADFGLALALDVQEGLREDLRILVMSATLDGTRVAGLLGDAPVIESEGRTFPVDIRHEDRPGTERIEQAVARVVRKTLAEETGSLLVFLPGQGEIRRVAEALEGRLPEGVLLAPLYGMMDIADQDRAIRPPEPGTRKVVLATAIAETSITIDGVRVVIDSGLARRPVFDPGSGLTRLETVRVSRAAAAQRAGRAGRTEPGVAIRLWRAEQTRALAEFDPPEILNADLAGLLLDCLAWGVADPASLRFMDPPPVPALDEARALLAMLGALDGRGMLTKKGAAMRDLALPARLAAMVVAAQDREDAFRRMLLALLVTERGAAGTGIDLGHRLDTALRGKGAQLARLRDIAKRAVAGMNLPQGDEIASAGAMLLDAWPDRVAKARGGRHGAFVMANGRGVALDETEPLAGEQYLVAADVTGAAREGRVTSAAAVTAEEIRAVLGDRIESVEQVEFDRQKGGLSARRVERLGAVVFSRVPVKVEPGEAATRALLDAVRTHGLGLLPWSKEVSQLRARLEWLHVRLGDPWPAMDDASLLDELEGWLAPFLQGAVNLSALDSASLRDALVLRVPPHLQREIDANAPPRFVAPTGSAFLLDYPADGTAPVVSLRVQELFGLKSHPSIAGGTVPLTLELLSPAHRPIQRTQDLPGFWAGSWAAVRAEMRGRYPKHPWPEDPANSEPTRRAKPRGR